MVSLITSPYAVACRTMFLGDFWVPFAQRKTLGSSFLVSSTSIVATVQHDNLSIPSSLDLEDTWTEALYAWVFVFKLVGMNGISLVFSSLYPITFKSETLKEYHDHTKMEFMWWGKIFVVPYSSIQ